MGDPQRAGGQVEQHGPGDAALSEAAQQAGLAHAVAREVLAEPLRVPQPRVAVGRGAAGALGGALPPRALGVKQALR